MSRRVDTFWVLGHKGQKKPTSHPWALDPDWTNKKMIIIATKTQTAILVVNIHEHFTSQVQLTEQIANQWGNQIRSAVFCKRFQVAVLAQGNVQLLDIGLEVLPLVSWLAGSSIESKYLSARQGKSDAKVWGGQRCGAAYSPAWKHRPDPWPDMELQVRLERGPGLYKICHQPLFKRLPPCHLTHISKKNQHKSTVSYQGVGSKSDH